MLVLIPKVPKIQRQKAMKIDVFDYPTVVWRPLSREASLSDNPSYIAKN